MRYDILKFVVFPYPCDFPEGATVTPRAPIDNVWETANFKMSYLMTYICFLLKIGDITFDIHTYKTM